MMNLLLLGTCGLLLLATSVLGLECHQGTAEWTDVDKWNDAGGPLDIHKKWTSKNGTSDVCHDEDVCVGILLPMSKDKDTLLLYRGCLNGEMEKYLESRGETGTPVVRSILPQGGPRGCAYSNNDPQMNCYFTSDLPNDDGKKIDRECLKGFYTMVKGKVTTNMRTPKTCGGAEGIQILAESVPSSSSSTEANPNAGGSSSSTEKGGDSTRSGAGSLQSIMMMMTLVVVTCGVLWTSS